MPGFPSYCTDSLLEIPPSNTVLVWLSIGLCAILDAYPPIPPKQVTVSCVPLTSYGFLQSLSLPNNALAIRIIFPLVRVIRHLSACRVCQLCWANKKTSSRLVFLFKYGARSETWTRTHRMHKILNLGCLPIPPSGQNFKIWRRNPESNRDRWICNPLHGHSAIPPKHLERYTRLELVTPTLARSCSTNWASTASLCLSQEELVNCFPSRCVRILMILHNESIEIITFFASFKLFDVFLDEAFRYSPI